jgi:tungstate transport system substrate-binding protein
MADEARPVILATTTSTQDSGLLDALVPRFEAQTKILVKTIAIGTGQALALGARGEADVVLCHAPDLETKYVEQGIMVDRRLVMHNEFVLVGRPSDPAKVRGTTDAVEAFRKVQSASATFVSRGDNSGTDILEKKLWALAGVQPKGTQWYIEAGQGMGSTLRITSEKRGYTLSDRGTYLAQRKNLELDIVSQGDPRLRNVYHVMLVNPAKFPKVNQAGGKAFADYLVSAAAQDVIREFGKQQFGDSLFVPDAGAIERPN